VRFKKIFLIFSGIAWLCLFSQPVLGKTKLLTDVKVIHASTGLQYIDPGLKKIIPELKSVFKYTSYRLLKDERLNQQFNHKGRVKLPGKRTLIITPLDMQGKRIQYQINIQKNKRLIFQTKVLLKNNRSITIGGPKFDNGVLLFNISGSTR